MARPSYIRGTPEAAVAPDMDLHVGPGGAPNRRRKFPERSLSAPEKAEQEFALAGSSGEQDRVVLRHGLITQSGDTDAVHGIHETWLVVARPWVGSSKASMSKVR